MKKIICTVASLMLIGSLAMAQNEQPKDAKKAETKKEAKATKKKTAHMHHKTEKPAESSTESK